MPQRSAQAHAPVERFRGTLGMGVLVCKPGDGQAKGSRRAGLLLPGDELLPGRRRSSEDFQRPAHRLARPGQTDGARHVAHRCGPHSDDAPLCSAARTGVAGDQAAPAGSLGAGRTRPARARRCGPPRAPPDGGRGPPAPPLRERLPVRGHRVIDRRVARARSGRTQPLDLHVAQTVVL